MVGPSSLQKATRLGSPDAGRSYWCAGLTLPWLSNLLNPVKDLPKTKSSVEGSPLGLPSRSRQDSLVLTEILGGCA